MILSESREHRNISKIIIALQKIMFNFPFRSNLDHQKETQKSRSILQNCKSPDEEARKGPPKQLFLLTPPNNSPIRTNPTSPRSSKSTHTPIADLTRSHHNPCRAYPNKQINLQSSFKQNSRVQLIEKANKPLTAQLYAKQLSFKTFPKKEEVFDNITNTNLKSNLQLRQTVTTSKGFLKNTLPPRSNNSPTFHQQFIKQQSLNKLNVSKQKENFLTPSKFIPKHARTRTTAENDAGDEGSFKFKHQLSHTNTPKTSTPRTTTPSTEKLPSPVNFSAKQTASDFASRSVSNFQKFLAKRLSTTLSPRGTVRKLQLSDFSIGPCKGEGRFGKVYPALHKRTGFLLAIKKIKKQLVQGMLKQFVGQLKIGLYLNHPNVVKTYGIFYDSDNIYILMEYMEEGSLYGVVRNGIIDQEQASPRLLEICQAVNYLHSLNIIHRDIKPENVVISNKTCKLCDFGWAVCSKQRRKTYCGTLDYVCPQILEGEAYDNEVDIWAIGVLAYEMLTGKAPFYHVSRQETMMNIMKCDFSFPKTMSSAAKSFIDKALQRNPDKRTTINELLKEDFLKEEQNQ